MATKTATAAAAVAAAVMNVTGATTRVVEYSLNGVTLSAGDVIQMMKIPSGARVADLAVAFDGLGAAGVQSYTLTGIGDGNDDNRYMLSQSVVTSSVVRMSVPGGFGYSYSAEDTVDITIGTITSGTAATATVRLTMTYYNQDTGLN